MNLRIPRTSLLVALINAGLLLACSPTDEEGGAAGRGGGAGNAAGAGGSSGGAGGSGGRGGGAGTGSGGTAGAGQGGATGGSAAAGGAMGGGGGEVSPDGGGQADSSGSTGSDGGTSPERGEIGAMGFPGWKYLKPIALDTSSTGAGITGEVTGYPVPVLLNATNFDFAQAKDLGEDLRFGKSDGTPLPYSIELWDKAAKTAAIWVKVDRIAGNNATQAIQMYWGNPAAGDASDSKQVFSTQDMYLGVWHLDEEGNATPGGYKDASAAGAHGTGMNLAAGSRVDGRIGKGTKTVNAMDQWVQVEDTGTKFRPTQLTASIWGRADAFPGRSGPGGYDTILSSGEYWTIQKFSFNRTFESCFQHICAVGRTQINTATWYLFTVVRDGSNHRFYVNGVRDATAGVNTRMDAKPLGLGNQTQYLTNAGEKRSWDGIIDEARVLGAAKDDSWIKLDYESAKEGSKFLVFGQTQMR